MNRLILGMAMVLVVGIPLVGVLYFLDQHRDAGPSMVQRAIVASEDAVRKNPNVIGSRLQLAAAYFTAERYADAIDQYGQVLKAETGNRPALLGRGQALVASGDLPAAARDYQAVIDAAKSEEMAGSDTQLQTAYYSLGSIQLTQGRARDAVDSLKAALGINRTDADALLALGTALTQTGDAKNAVIAFRKAAALVPTGWCEPYAGLQTAYQALGQPAGAQYAGAMAAFCGNQPDLAKERLQALSSGEFAVDALVGLALIAENERDAAAAADYYDQVLAKDSQNFAAITGLNRVTQPGASPAPSAPAGGSGS
jgi:tetratricopeptide (TPR) repeat protein